MNLIKLYIAITVSFSMLCGMEENNQSFQEILPVKRESRYYRITLNRLGDKIIQREHPGTAMGDAIIKAIEKESSKPLFQTLSYNVYIIRSLRVTKVSGKSQCRMYRQICNELQENSDDFERILDKQMKKK